MPCGLTQKPFTLVLQLAEHLSMLIRRWLPLIPPYLPETAILEKEHL
jgi:hypothetical protein